jgi:hypothetical protein
MSGNPATRTYGRLSFQGVRPGEAAYAPRGMTGVWRIKAHPHAIMRIKDILKGADNSVAGFVAVTDTLDNARDIEMVLTRWPLEMDKATRRVLEDRCRSFRDRERALEDVLLGNGRTFGIREPIRPPMPFYEQGCTVPFQEQAAQLGLTVGSTLIGDDLGFGKTFSSILTLNADDSLPALVVCQAHLCDQWADEVADTLPWLSTHVVKSRSPFLSDGTAYDTKNPDGSTPDVLIISYSKLDGWHNVLAGLVKTVVYDEVQELRHDGTNKALAAKAISDRANRSIGLSNTPVYNYGIEAFNIINILAPGALGDESEFKREWCVLRDGKWMIEDPGAFGAFLRERGLLYARTYEDLGRYLRVGPDGLLVTGADGQSIPVPASEVAKGIPADAKWVALERPKLLTVVENVDYDTSVIDAAISDAAELARFVLSRAHVDHEKRFTAAGQLDSIVRQATGVAKALPVAAYVRMLLQTQERVVLFGWHRAVYDLWLDALADLDPVLYTGTETPKRKRKAKAVFCGGGSRVLIVSLRSGTGLDGLQHWCEDVVFGELDWSPMVMRQGEGRVARGLMRSNLVTAHYLISAGGSDPLMERLLQLKRGQAEPIMTKDGGLFQAPPVSLKRGQELAASVLSRLGEPLPTAETSTASMPPVPPRHREVVRAYRAEPEAEQTLTNTLF